MNEILYKILPDGSLEEAPASIITPDVRIDNPSIAVYHKFGYWPKVDTVKPDEEEGYIVYDDGNQYVDDGQGGKVVKHVYRKLQIVDPGMPEIPEGYEFLGDYWMETETQRIHVYKVYKVIDIAPVLADDQIALYADKEVWVIDDAAKTKTRDYGVRTKIDNPPVLAENQIIFKDYWQDDGEKFYTHIYELRFIVDNPPTLEPGQQVVEDHWEDDGVTRTHIYDKIMFVVDNPPVLEEGQQIIDRWFEDNEETNTRTWFYTVRFVVDNPPVLAENEYIFEEHWEDDGTTRTHIYVTHFKVDNPPVLEPGQEIIEDHWEYDEATRTETHVYTVRFIVDNPPELAEDQFIYEDHWDDDGTTRTHVYDVWTKVDEVPAPEEGKRAVATDDWEDFPETKQRKRVYIIKTIVDQKPADDPDGNFYWVADGEEETDTEIIIKYKKVFKEWRILSKLKIEMAVFQLGKLTKFDQFLNGTTMTNEAGETATLKRFYDQANELAENHKLFAPYCQAAFAAMEISAEQGEMLLTQCTEKTFIIDESGARVYL